MKNIIDYLMSKKNIFNLIINIGFIIFNFSLAIYYKSIWFVTFGIYYTILFLLRFLILYIYKSERINNKKISFYISSILFILISIVMIGITVLTYTFKTGTKFNEIIIISMAAYTTYKITMSIINHKKAREKDDFLYIIRTIGLADAFISLSNLQRNMLASFDDGSSFAVNMNLCLNITIAVFVLILGIFVFIKGIKKSKEIEE